MKKKCWRSAVCVGLALIMTLSLAACGKKEADGPGAANENTVQALFDGVQELDLSKYTNMTMVVSASSQDSGATVNMQAGFELKGDIMHIYDMSMNIAAGEGAMAISIEGWLDRAANLTYMNASMFGEESGWMKSSENVPDLDVDSITQLSDNMKDMVADSMRLLERKDGEDYVVEWQLDPNDVNSAGIMSIMGSTLEDYQMMDTVGVITAQATFDANTRDLKSVTAWSGDDSEVIVNMAVVFAAKNMDKDLAIPQEVIDSAVAGDELGEELDDMFD